MNRVWVKFEELKTRVPHPLFKSPISSGFQISAAML